MSPEVAIIVPCYNQEAYIGEALDSVLAQSFTNWECIIINDGSTDNTRDVVSKYTQVDKRVKYFEKQNEGPSTARNYGISLSSAEYILPVDGDDKISPNYVEECFKVLRNDTSIKLVYGAGEKFGVKNEAWKLKPFSRTNLLFNNMIHCSGMYRKADWERVGGYDPKMTYGLEDWEFWISLVESDLEVVRLDNIQFSWRIKNESRTTNINNWKESKMRQYVYAKHASLYDEFFVDPLTTYQQKKELEVMVQQIEKSPFRFFCSRLIKGKKRAVVNS